MNPLPPIVNVADNEVNVLDEVLNLIPHGFKFRPDDVELIEYLKVKIVGDFKISGRIYDVDVYKHSPQELNDKYKREGEQHTYFFTPRNRKYPNGNRPDRAVGGVGFWKATGRDNPISSNNTIIGFKKTLVFYKGKPKDAVKTNWIMQEFTLNKEKILANSSAAPSCKMQLDDWVLCKIYKNKRDKENEDSEEVNKHERKNEDTEEVNKRKRKSEYTRKDTISTNMITAPQHPLNQLSHAQHMQTPFSSYISESSTYPASFLPPPSSSTMPPLDDEIDIDTFLDFESKDLNLTNKDCAWW